VKALRLNKFNIQADAFCHRMEYPFGIDKFMAIEVDLPIYIMWINFVSNDKYSPELVGYYGFNGTDMWLGGEGGRAGTPWLSQLKEFVVQKSVGLDTDVVHVARDDQLHMIRAIVITHERIEIHIHEVEEGRYE
jgi:hypothetical protein